MKQKIIDHLFFCRTHDYLHIYIPQQQNGTANTLATYKAGLRSFRTYVNDIAKISTNKFRFQDCSYDFLLDYRNFLHDSRHLAERTANNRLAVIKSYMNYASARDVSLQQYAFAISQVPFYTEPKIHQPVIEDVSALAALLAMPPNTKKGLRDKVIMSVLYDGATRLEELLSLKIGDLNLNNDDIRIRIHGKGNKERTIILDTKTTALVRQYLMEFHPELEANTPFIYTIIDGVQKRMSKRNVQKLMKKYADKARMNHELPKSVSPHTLRRTRGTMLYRDGVPLEAISIMLGHSNTKTTRDHYSSPSFEQMRAIANKKNEAIPDEPQLWPDDEEEMAKILGF